MGYSVHCGGGGSTYVAVPQGCCTLGTAPLVSTLPPCPLPESTDATQSTATESTLTLTSDASQGETAEDAQTVEGGADTYCAEAPELSADQVGFSGGTMDTFAQEA